MKDRNQILTEGREKPEFTLQGNLEAFDLIWHKYSARVYNFISMMLYEKSASEDLTQDVFLKVWEKRDEIDIDGNLEGYIFTIARHLVYKETRKMMTSTVYKNFIRQSMDESDDSSQKSIDAQSEHRHLMEIINQMPPSRRDIYLLNKIHGLPVKEIAARLGLSPRTIENQLYKANTFIKTKFPMSVFVLLWIYLIYGKF